MKKKLLDLIFEYASKSEWIGYHSGLSAEDEIMKKAVLERDIAERNVIEMLENINVEAKNGD